MTSLAIITARGGSKRIPKKNIKEFYGKPIIAYSIEAALQSGVFDTVMVSTDADEIARIARAYGADVPFMRSADTSGDYATTADVLAEVVGEYEKRGLVFDRIGCLYPTAPFVTPDKLRRAAKQMEEAGADAVMTVVRYSFPPQRAMVVREGKLSYQYPEYANARSQDLEPIYHDCGQFYLCRTEAFLRYHTMVVPGTVPFVVPDEEVQDIDSPSDWEIAQAKFAVFLNR